MPTVSPQTGPQSPHRKRRATMRLALTLLAVLLAPAQLRAEGDAPVAVYSHPSVDNDWLTRDFLRAAFTMRVRVWPDGQPIIVYVLDDSAAAHEVFCREVLGTFPYVLRRTWDRMTFTGTGVSPRRVSSLEEMRQRINATPGAVGYLRSPPSGEATSPRGVRS